MAITPKIPDEALAAYQAAIQSGSTVKQAMVAAFRAWPKGALYNAYVDGQRCLILPYDEDPTP